MMETMQHSLGSSITNAIRGQLLSRAISFLINMYLLRRVDGSLIGVINVNLMLYYTTCIFLIREPFRKAFLSSKESYSSIVNHLWLAPLLFPFIAIPLAYLLWIPFSSLPPTSLVPSYSFCLFCFGFSAWIESLAEPFVIISLRSAMDAEYAFAQGVLTVSQRLFVLFLITATEMEHISAFCSAQLISSILYLITCVVQLFRRVNRRSHLHLTGGPYLREIIPELKLILSREDLSMLFTFIVHSSIKHALTDGAGFVLTFTDHLSLSTKGTYDAIDKLGGLVARIIFAPLEHSAYLYFSANLRRDYRSRMRNKEFMGVLDVLIGLLHVTFVVGVVVCTFAIPYSPLAVSIYGGGLLSQNSGANILRLYCVYVVVIAVNGITECFTMATMSSRQLIAHGWFLFIITPIYLFSAFILSYCLGAFGLVSANIINMVLRIIYSWSYIRQYLSGRINFFAVLPSASTVFLLIFCCIICTISLMIFGPTGGIIHSAAHVAVGGALFIFVINHIYHNDFSVAHFINSHLIHVSSGHGKE